MLTEGAIGQIRTVGGFSRLASPGSPKQDSSRKESQGQEPVDRAEEAQHPTTRSTEPRRGRWRWAGSTWQRALAPAGGWPLWEGAREMLTTELMGGWQTLLLRTL